MKSISNMSLRVPSRLDVHWSDSALTMMIDECGEVLTVVGLYLACIEWLLTFIVIVCVYNY